MVSGISMVTISVSGVFCVFVSVVVEIRAVAVYAVAESEEV